MVLGLNDTFQITNTVLRNYNELTNYIIKPTVNKELGNQTINDVQSIIDESTYICVYGSSIGETDNYWWDYIIQWLAKSNGHRLVLNIYDSNHLPASGQESLRFRDKHRKEFLQKTQKNNSIKPNELLSRIIVIPNSKIFNLEGVTIKQDELQPI